MVLRHATTRQRLASIQATGLRVAMADPAAKMKGVWLHTASNSSWATVHTMHKHGAALDDVVILEVNVPRSHLKRFRTGLWVVQGDVPATQLTGQQWDGAAFGASAQ